MMHKMERQNVVTYVDDSKVEKYLSLGYTEVDSTGKVLRRNTAHTVESLQIALTQATEEIERLQNENTQLKARFSEVVTATPINRKKKP